MKTAAQVAPGQHVHKLTWAQARERIRAINSDFLSAIDTTILTVGAMVPKKLAAAKDALPVFIASYSYGEELVTGGCFNSPCAARGVQRECQHCEALSNAVTYASIPLSLVLTNCVEVYIDYENRTAPLSLFKQGDLFGLFESLDRTVIGGVREKPPWSVSAGATSIHIIGPAKDSRIRQHLSHQSGRALSEVEWETIRDTPWKFVQFVSAMKSRPWTVEVLIFPSQWMTLEMPIMGSQFYEFMLKLGWKQSRPLRLQSIDEALAKKPHRDDMYYYRTARHICAIAAGLALGFEPVRFKESQTGPLIEFREWLAEELMNLKATYTPAILQPCYLMESRKTAYYSVSRPSIAGPVLTKDDGKWVHSARKIGNVGNLQKVLDCLQTLEGGVVPSDLKTITGMNADEAKKQILPEEFLPPKENPAVISKNEMRILNFDSPRGEPSFFSACIRVVRE